MKKLVVSVKPTRQLLQESLNRLKRAEKKNWKVEPHFEVSFTDIKQFKRFISNIDLLSSIQSLKPESIYELAKQLDKDVGNLNKLINFYKETGAIELKESRINGRIVKKPIVPFKKIEFDLVS